MSKTNSKPQDRTIENTRNRFAQSTFAAQCNHANITGKMEIVPARTLFLRALVFILFLIAIVGMLATLIMGAM